MEVFALYIGVKFTIDKNEQLAKKERESNQENINRQKKKEFCNEIVMVVSNFIVNISDYFYEIRMNRKNDKRTLTEYKPHRGVSYHNLIVARMLLNGTCGEGIVKQMEKIYSISAALPEDGIGYHDFNNEIDQLLKLLENFKKQYENDVV